MHWFAPSFTLRDRLRRVARDIHMDDFIKVAPLPPGLEYPPGVKANEHDRSLTPREVLAVLADFDRFGGSSVALIAWELGAPEESVADLASQAAKEGLLRPSGVDPVSGEDMWRLTGLGRGRQARR